MTRYWVARVLLLMAGFMQSEWTLHPGIHKYISYDIVQCILYNVLPVTLCYSHSVMVCMVSTIFSLWNTQAHRTGTSLLFQAVPALAFSNCDLLLLMCALATTLTTFTVLVCVQALGINVCICMIIIKQL